MNHTPARNPETLQIHVAETRQGMGERAADDIAKEIQSCLNRRPAPQQEVRIVFAAAPSQSEMLAALSARTEVEWRRVLAFHMDEYLGLPPDAPRRFSRWLRGAIFDRLPFASVHLLDTGKNPEQAAENYAAKLNAAPIDIVCCGVGVNAHLAFNDPPADFDDPLTVKIVELDDRCRRQQVDDGCFASLDEVPARALTVTVPALLRARAIFCTVPGARKRDAVRRMLTGPIGPECPASALRNHPRCTLYLDRDASNGVPLQGYMQV